MHVVAIVELGTPIEAEAAALAADLESTVYEQRLNLVAGLPAIVLATPEPGRAQQLLRALRKRGHGAVAFDGATVVPSGEMVPLRHCQLESDGLTTERPTTPGLPPTPAERVERLLFDDILALIRATHRRRVQTTTEVTQRQFGIGRAVASGGLLLTKKVTREETRVTDERDQVLYIFRKSGERPWFLSERSAGYGWLGETLAPSSLQNFIASIALLRARAPSAPYDERLMGSRKPIVFAAHGGTAKSGGANSSDQTADLVAHLLALWFAQQTG